MKKLLAKELKIKFIEILNEVDGFSYEDGNPFLIKIGNERYFIFLKNLSPAYYVNYPDITRVQLPYSEHFSKILKANIPFIILGYDVDNDTVVSWNPKKVKERLNAKSNVSLYSRESLQSPIKINEFKSGYLSNGEKIILFNRETLPLFFEDLTNLFENSKTELKYSKVHDEPLVLEEPDSESKLIEIKDKILIAELRPLLQKHKVLEAVKVSTKHYGNKYKVMTFKDWFNIINDLYKKLHE